MKFVLSMFGLLPALYLGIGSITNHQHSQSCEHGGFIPKEFEVQVEENSFFSAVTERDFVEVIEKVEQVYQPIIKQKKSGVLTIEKDWSDTTVNAYASVNGSSYNITVLGGIGRHAESTIDGVALVTCHEVGHFLGENPRYPNRWASNEGQSDYFGALKCFKKVFEHDDNITIVSNMNVAPYAKSECSRYYPNDPSGNALCQRISMAGMALGRLLASVTRIDPNKIKFETPDSRVVKTTSNSHPAAQCRLDTYFAGALCPVNHNLDFDENDPNVNACTHLLPNEFQNSARPKCWYKPQ